VDCVLVLEGEQGTRKSSLLRLLCYDNFLDGGIDMKSKDGLMSLFGKWIIEFSELEGMNGKSSDTIKAFLAKQDDKIRLPYGKTEQFFKRTCVFVGTTNKEHYLEDPTGNRRFWPIKISKADLIKLEADRDQIWGEAYQAFRNGEKWWIDEEEDDAKCFRSEQAGRVIHSDIEDHIAEYLKEKVIDDGRTLVKLHDIWTECLDGKLNQLDSKKEREIAECLRRMGFKKTKVRHSGTFFRGWVKVGGTHES
jgi:predicted P-loop ATPase